MNATCYECGVSALTAGNLREAHFSFRLQKASYCPACWAKRQRRLLRWSIILGVIALLAIAAATRVAPDRMVRIGWIALNVALLYFFAYLMILPHELGHALCAVLVDWGLFRISLGWGRTLWQCRLAGCAFEINAAPLGGLTWTAPREVAHFRGKYFLIVLLGPFVNLAVLLIALLCWPAVPLSSFDLGQGLAPWPMLAAANLLLLVGALLPYKVEIIRGPLAVTAPTDGLALVTAPFLSRSAIEQVHAAYFALEGHQAWEERDYQSAKEWYEAGLELYPRDIANRMGLGMAQLFLKDFAAAREQWLAVLKRGDLSRYIRAGMLNNVAWVDLLIGGPDLLDEADRFSDEAVQEEPWRPELLGTRGSVLIERGEPAKGIPLVKRAMDHNHDPRLKALNACYLALGEMNLGNQQASEKYLQQALGLDPDCQLLSGPSTWSQRLRRDAPDLPG